MEIPPCPECGGEPAAPCPTCGRRPPRRLPAPGGLAWETARRLLAAGRTTPRRLAAHYGRDLADILAWVYQAHHGGARR